MTVASSSNKIQYSGNGSQTAFPYAFRIFADANLVVTRAVTATGVETTLVLNTDYTVSGAGSYNGGTVTTAVAPATGTTLTIRRVLATTQGVDLRNQGAFFAETHETVFDRLTMIDQQQQEEIDRSLKLAESDVSGSGAYQADGNRITDLDDPDDPSDAVTKSWVEQLVLNAIENGPGYVGLQYEAPTAVAINLQRYIEDGEYVLNGFVNKDLHDDIRAGTYTADLTTQISNMVSEALSSGRSARFFDGTFYANLTITGGAGFWLKGTGKTRLRSYAAGGQIMKFMGSTTNDQYKIIEGFVFDGNSLADNGVQFGDGTGSGASEQNQNSIWRYCKFLGLNHAWRKSDGNLGHHLYNCTFDSNNYDIELRNTGSSFDAGATTIQDTLFGSTNTCMIYVETTGNTGRVTINGGGVYGHYGHAFWIERFLPLGEPQFEVTNFWMEKFSTRPVVNKTITKNDGSTKTILKSDIYLNNASGIIFDKMAPRLIRAGSTGAKMVLQDCFLSDDMVISGESTEASPSVALPNNNTIIVRGARTDGCSHVPHILCESVSEVNRKIAGFAFSAHTPLRNQVVSGLTGTAITFDMTRNGVVTRPAGQSEVMVQDGVGFDTCLEITRTSAATGQSQLSGNLSLTANKWYVMYFNYKVVSAPADGVLRILLGASNSFNNSTYLDLTQTGIWRTISCIGYTDGTPPNVTWLINDSSGSSDIVLRLSALGLKQFDNEQQAIEFFNSRSIATNSPKAYVVNATVTQATDNTATTFLTINAPNSAQEGSIDIQYLLYTNGNVGDRWEESGRVVVAWGREAGNATSVTVTKCTDFSQSTRLGASTYATTFAAAAAVGAVGAAQTIDIQFTANAGTADGSTIIARAVSLINGGGVVSPV